MQWTSACTYQGCNGMHCSRTKHIPVHPISVADNICNSSTHLCEHQTIVSLESLVCRDNVFLHSNGSEDWYVKCGMLFVITGQDESPFFKTALFNGSVHLCLTSSKLWHDGAFPVGLQIPMSTCAPWKEAKIAPDCRISEKGEHGEDWSMIRVWWGDLFGKSR